MQPIKRGCAGNCCGCPSLRDAAAQLIKQHGVQIGLRGDIAHDARFEFVAVHLLVVRCPDCVIRDDVDLIQRDKALCDRRLGVGRDAERIGLRIERLTLLGADPVDELLRVLLLVRRAVLDQRDRADFVAGAVLREGKLDMVTFRRKLQ